MWVKNVVVPPIEKLITSTPSMTAWSIAATLSEKKHVPRPAPLSKQILYVEMRARGAMPLILPDEAGSCTPALPPAVDEVWVPCPP